MEAIPNEFQDPIPGFNIKYKATDVFLELSLMPLAQIGDYTAY